MKRNSRIAALILAAALMTLAGALGAPVASAQTGVPCPDGPGVCVSGNVTYRERIALPVTAELAVQLIDITQQGGPAPVVAEERVALQGAQPPFGFYLPYDPARIVASNTYALRASIRADETLLFQSVEPARVLTGGSPASGVELVLTRVIPTGAQAQQPQRITIDSPPIGTLVGSPVTVTGRAARYPRDGVLGYRFVNARRQVIGRGDLFVSGSPQGPVEFIASLSFALPPEGGDIRLELFERGDRGAELGLVTRSLFVAPPQAIQITSPAPFAAVASPVTVGGSLARLPDGSRLHYLVLASDGRQLGSGSFSVLGSPGRPASFLAPLTFEASPEGDRIQVQLFDRAQATGEVIAQAAVTLGVAPQPQQIILETPRGGAYVGTPVVLTGRTVRYPAGGSLGYAIYRGDGLQVGGGVFPVSGSLAVGGRFQATLSFAYPPQGGPLRVDLYDQDPATGAFRATASLSLQSVPLQQQIVIESPQAGTQVGDPVVITGRTARYPRDGLLQYRIVDQAGQTLASGNFAVQGPNGEPARFSPSLRFTPPALSGPLRADIFETDAFGNVVASASVEMRWVTGAGAARQIVIETPPAGTLVGNPLVVTGRANFYPTEGTLRYRVLDLAGAELSSGFATVQPEAGGARFVISAPYRPLPGGGVVAVEVFAVDEATGAFIARARVELRQAP